MDTWVLIVNSDYEYGVSVHLFLRTNINQFQKVFAIENAQNVRIHMYLYLTNLLAKVFVNFEDSKIIIV